MHGNHVFEHHFFIRQWSFACFTPHSDLVSSRQMSLQSHFGAESFSTILARKIFATGDAVSLNMMIVILLISERSSTEFTFVELVAGKSLMEFVRKI
jgi:hypothetical protein